MANARCFPHDPPLTAHTRSKAVTASVENFLGRPTGLAPSSVWQPETVASWRYPWPNP